MNKQTIVSKRCKIQTHAHKKQAGRHTEDIPQKTSKLYLL